MFLSEQDYRNRDKHKVREQQVSVVMEMRALTTLKVQYSLILFVILVPLLFITCASAGETDSQEDLNPRIAHEIILDAFSWEAISIECKEGVVLSGSFVVTCEGSLYPGDDQKYDDWTRETIHFYILNESEYSHFVERDEFSPSYLREDKLDLNWQFQIPDEGQWYIVYHNTSIYLITVNGQIDQPGLDFLTLLISVSILLGVVLTVSVILLSRSRR